METFFTSRIKSSMDWVASVFSGFGLPVCDCRLWWKSSSARMTLLTSLRASVRVAGSCSRIARYASFEVIPQAKRARRSRSDTPALHLISATSWAYCSMGLEPLDQLPCRLLRAVRAQQSLLELLEGVLLSCPVG
ncbi:hypothetical protein T09_14822 [Trichinella sp. T9]|nr:hypothetical protein T09_14822 [Trichinella sp. T9]